MRIEDLKYDIPQKPVDSENWDVERWRKENPPDYFKALSILSMAKNDDVKAGVFTSITNIFRLYVPETLYKYYSLTDIEKSNEKKFQTILNKKLYLSAPKDFNDPFDCKGFFYDPTQLTNIEWLRPYGGRIIDDFSSYIRSASLTENGIQSMPMWAHYANNHKGFCISYSKNENLDIQSLTFPVQYTDERLDITSTMKIFAEYIHNATAQQSVANKEAIVLNDFSILYTALLLYNIKHSSWSYEKEFRCSAGATAKGMPYVDAKPKEIFVGMNCSSSHTQRLVEIAKMLEIPIYKMDFDNCSVEYKLIAKKLG